MKCNSSHKPESFGGIIEDLGRIWHLHIAHVPMGQHTTKMANLNRRNCIKVQTGQDQIGKF
eukprot:3201706-Amphidinium_carterae.1